MEMKLPEAWSSLANTLPAFGEVHRNAQHKETWNNCRELAAHHSFYTTVHRYPHRHAAFPVRLTRLFAHVLCNSPYGLKQTQNMSGSVLLTTEASQLSVGIAVNCYIVQKITKITYFKDYLISVYMESFKMAYTDVLKNCILRILNYCRYRKS